MKSLSCVAALLLLALGGATALLCPDTPKYNGCRTEACVGIPTSRRTMDVVCDACGEGYILAYRGTNKATCECAPGWAGKGNNGVCMKCPMGTQVAPGGPIALSTCLSCPETTIWSERSQECLCPPGTQFERDLSQASGFKHVNCKPCAGKLEYMDLVFHDRRQCKLCPAGLVPTTDRTACVPANHAEAYIAPRGFEAVMGKIQALNPFAAKDDPERPGEKRPDFTHVLAEMVNKWAKSGDRQSTSAEASSAPVTATVLSANVDGPQAEAPKAEAPKAEAPKVEAPKAEAPKAEAPKVEAPKVEAPKAEAPQAEAPKVEAPKEEAPKA